MDDLMTRRSALARGFGGVFLVCALDFDKRPRATSAYLRSAGQFDPFQRDVPIPPVARPVTRSRSAERYVLTMRPSSAEIVPGLQTPILGYEGRFPGPTIHATRGRAVEIVQRNQSGRELNVHLHGGVTRPEFDGHPHDAIPNGAERLYKYPNVQRSATLWYHDHAHGETAKTLYAGLAAFYIVSDPEEEALELPAGDYDVPLMLTDRSFNADGSFRYRVDVDRGFRGDTILVNGAIAPRMRVERRLYRLRFLNAANAREFVLALGNNRAMTQIGSEGGLLAKPVRRTQISLQPAERADVVIDFRQFGAGSKVILHNAAGEASTRAVMRFDVVRGRREEARVPKVLSELEELPAVNAQRSFPLTFQGLGRAQWQIAGAGFGMERIDCRPRQGSTELWTFTNNSERQHPMHLHGYHFRVVSIAGRRPHPGDSGWKDTVSVAPRQTVVVRPYFDYFPGRYVFHCHAAEHGDMSMMGQMEVVA
jgi:FtsP/CotA-like multicopper oxidase with cupredoxin domain